MRSYLNRVVYITGGSSGIGLEAAKLLSSLGASVAIFGRDRGKLDAAICEIMKQRIAEQQEYLAVPLDVADRKAVPVAMAEAVKQIGPPDVLINSAGAVITDYFENITCEQCEDLMRVNFHGTWNTVAALLPYMKAKGGNIVNVSSVAGFVGLFGYTAYGASKFAVVGFSEALRGELRRHGITVSVLAPPDTDTPQLVEDNRTKPPETKAVSGNAKVMQPDEVARAMVKGMEKGKFMIVPGSGRIVFHAKRLLPGLVDSAMAGDIRKAQRKATSTPK